MDVPPLPEGLYQFKWPVDEAGYQFGPLPPIRHREARARGENPNRTYLFRRSGTLVDKFPLREAPALFLDFAAMATGQVPESKVIAFANRHAILFLSGSAVILAHRLPFVPADGMTNW